MDEGRPHMAQTMPEIPRSARIVAALCRNTSRRPVVCGRRSSSGATRAVAAAAVTPKRMATIEQGIGPGTRSDPITQCARVERLSAGQDAPAPHAACSIPVPASTVAVAIATGRRRARAGRLSGCRSTTASHQRSARREMPGRGGQPPCSRSVLSNRSSSRPSCNGMTDA